MIGVSFPIEDSLADELICVCGGFIGVLAINLALFLDYRRAPKSNFEINNNGLQYTESGFVRVLPLYKLDPIEYHDDFIVVAKKYILQKELLVQGDWEELKILFKKVEESLET